MYCLLLLYTLPLCCSGDIVALNKPSGVAVHSGPKVKSDLSRFLHYWQYEEHQLPELAHRLDKLVPLAIAGDPSCVDLRVKGWFTIMQCNV